MQKTCALLDPQLGVHWDTPSTLNGAGCPVWTTEQRSWVSAQRGILYNNRPPSQAGQLHPATEKKAGSPPPHVIHFSIYTLPMGSHPVYSPHAWRSCPSLAPAAHCVHRLEETLAVRLTAESAHPCKPQLPRPSVLATSRAASPPVTSYAL